MIRESLHLSSPREQCSTPVCFTPEQLILHLLVKHQHRRVHELKFLPKLACDRDISLEIAQAGSQPDER